MQGFILTATEKCTLAVDLTKNLTKFMEREMKVKGIGSSCMLEEYVKDNYYARFHAQSYNCCGEMHFSSRLELNFDKVNGA